MKNLIYLEHYFNSLIKGYNLSSFTKELLFKEFSFYSSEKGTRIAEIKLNNYLKSLKVQ